MNKKSILYIILNLIFLAVFNVVFFVVGGAKHPASVWISYGFIHFAYIMMTLTPFLIRKSSSAAVFGFSLNSISSAYFFVELIVGLIFIYVGSDSYKASFVIQIIIAGIYAVLLISNMIANEHTAENVERREAEVAYIKTASSRVKLLLDKTNDKKANKEIEKAYDFLHSSPTRSVSTVKALEAEILDKVSDLERAVNVNSIEKIFVFTGEIIALTEERNRQIMLANR